MKEPIVTDSTCLIGLDRIGHLDVLPSLFEPVIIPPEVNQEFGVHVSWLITEVPSATVLIAALSLLVDAGEAERLRWRASVDVASSGMIGRHGP